MKAPIARAGRAFIDRFAAPGDWLEALAFKFGGDAQQPTSDENANRLRLLTPFHDGPDKPEAS